MKITKAYLSRQLSLANPVLSINQAKCAVEALLRLAKQSLAEGQPLLLSGFGKFKILHKNNRLVRNPTNGDKFMLEPRTVVTFKTSANLRRRINNASMRSKPIRIDTTPSAQSWPHARPHRGRFNPLFKKPGGRLLDRLLLYRGLLMESKAAVELFRVSLMGWVFCFAGLCMLQGPTE